MPAGRPLKFQTEKDFVDYLYINRDKRVSSLLGEKIKNIYRNKSIIRTRFGGNTARADLIIETVSGKRICVECKNPKQVFHELSRSVSQLLSYGVIAEECGKPFDILVLVTSEIHDIAFKITKRYNLPIRLFYIDREIHGEIK